MDKNFNLAPVDWAAKSIINLSKFPRNFNENSLIHNSDGASNSHDDVFHITNTSCEISLKKIMEFANNSGFYLQPLPYQKWKELLTSQNQNPLYPLISFYGNKNMPGGILASNLATKKSLEILNLPQCPEISEGIVQRNFKYLITIK